MAYDVQVRKTLNQRGIDNNRIGYNVNTGTVTVDGKDFLRPQKNINGTTFTDQGSFDKAYSSFFQQNQTPQQVTPIQQQPMTSQNIIGEVYNMLKNQTPYDVYSSPEYTAAAQAQQRAAQQGVRTAQEALGASGFARSTNLADRAQRIQNQANEYLLTQVVPQLIAQNEARRQQQIGNLYNLISPLMRGEEFGKTFALQEGQLTGNYLPSDLQPLLDEAISNSYAWRNASPEEQARLAARNQEIYRIFDTRGFDSSLIGADVSPEQKRINARNLGIPTLAARQFAESQRQFDEQNALAKRKFDEDVRQFGLQYALQQQAAARAAAKASGSSETSGRGLIGTGTNLSSSERKELQKDALAYIQDMQDGKITPEQARQEINSYRSVYGDEYVNSLLAAIDDYAKQKEVESERNRIRAQQTLQDIIRNSIRNSQTDPYPGFSFPPLT